jgi:hypothetical protein
MNVFCNGFPKSGNHALMKACELLGVPAVVNHIPYAEGLPEGTTHHVLIARDPRNIIVSWLRFHRDVVAPGKFLARFRQFESRSLAEELAQYEKWLWTAYVIRYEALIADDTAMRELARYLGVPYLEGAWEELDGLTVTWNAIKSDYRDVWTPEVIAAWYAEGGGKLLLRWGY